MSDESESSVDNQEVKVVYDIVDIIQLRQSASRDYLEVNPVLRAVVDGVCDEKSVLGLLNGVPDVVQLIWDLVVTSWGRCIKEPTREDYGNVKNPAVMRLICRDYGDCEFPKPTGIRINMMPFVMAESFEESRLPKYLKPYWNAFLGRKFWLSESHMFYIEGNMVSKNQIGKIGYLTIDERKVKAGETQRRPGLHTDCPGKLMLCRENNTDDYICLGRVTPEEEEKVYKLIDANFGEGHSEESIVNFVHPWGMTFPRESFELMGGIYMRATWKTRIVCGIARCKRTMLTGPR